MLLIPLGAVVDYENTLIILRTTPQLSPTQKKLQYLMDPCYFRCCCCCPRLNPFPRRPGWTLLARKSQSRHHLAFEIQSPASHTIQVSTSSSSRS
ncbi:hypothetical protein TNCV_3445541 [Trichonephila clavipes]|nr:hypothetical protein TNCV_3445541 [Trichonephila clavipes]